MIVPIVNCPSVLLMQVGSFLVARDLLRLCQVCRKIWAQCGRIVTPLAQKEQRRIQVEPLPFHVQLTFFDVAAYWRQLPDSTARAIREALSLRPLVFYARRFRPVDVLLTEAALVARHDPEEMSSLARQEQNIGNAIILARNILNQDVRNSTINVIALRPAVSIEDTFAIARTTDEGERVAMLNDLPNRPSIEDVINRGYSPIHRPS